MELQEQWKKMPFSKTLRSKIFDLTAYDAERLTMGKMHIMK